jgi:hypothetical protein
MPSMQCLDCGAELQRKTRGRAPKRCPACYEIRRSWKPATSRTCERCGIEYQGIRNQRFCGNSCANTADRQDKRCPQCGNTFQVTKASRKILCGLGCLAAYTAARTKVPVRRHTCEVCGKEFQRNHGANRCCSRECGWKLPKRIAKSDHWRHLWFRDCVVCGDRFVTSRKPRVICTRRECHLEINRRKEHEIRTRAPRPICTCLECGLEFIPAAADKRRLFCSHKCCSRAGGRDTKARRKLIIKSRGGYGIQSTAIRFTDVWDRTGGYCHICGKLCARREMRLELKPTLDHVMPLSRGGSHLMPNAAVAHFICNAFKGDRPLTPELSHCCALAVAEVKNGGNGWRFHPLKAAGAPWRPGHLKRVTAAVASVKICEIEISEYGSPRRQTVPA